VKALGAAYAAHEAVKAVADRLRGKDAIARQLPRWAQGGVPELVVGGDRSKTVVHAHSIGPARSEIHPSIKEPG